MANRSAERRGSAAAHGAFTSLRCSTSTWLSPRRLHRRWTSGHGGDRPHLLAIGTHDKLLVVVPQRQVVPREQPVPSLGGVDL
ncbi:MAG: hypothetical protein ACYCU6_04025, partial [Acidimicrobiales bacterium]